MKTRIKEAKAALQIEAVMSRWASFCARLVDCVTHAAHARIVARRRWNSIFLLALQRWRRRDFTSVRNNAYERRKKQQEEEWTMHQQTTERLNLAYERMEANCRCDLLSESSDVVCMSCRYHGMDAWQDSDGLIITSQDLYQLLQIVFHAWLHWIGVCHPSVSETNDPAYIESPPRTDNECEGIGSSSDDQLYCFVKHYLSTHDIQCVTIKALLDATAAEFGNLDPDTVALVKSVCLHIIGENDKK